MGKPLALGARHHGGSSPLYPTKMFQQSSEKSSIKKRNTRGVSRQEGHLSICSYSSKVRTFGC